MAKKKTKTKAIRKKTVKYSIVRDLKEPAEKLTAQFLIRLSPAESFALKARALKKNEYVSRLLRSLIVREMKKWK